MSPSVQRMEIGEEEDIALDSKRNEDSRLVRVDDRPIQSLIASVPMKGIDDDAFLGELECPSEVGRKRGLQPGVFGSSLDSDLRARYSARDAAIRSSRWSERKNASRSAQLIRSMSSGWGHRFRRPSLKRRPPETRRSRNVPAAINGVSAVIAGSFPQATYRALI
jgi:hypothetical protein